MKLNYFWLVCVNKVSLFLVPGYHNGNDFSTVRKANPFWLVQSWNPHNKYKQTKVSPAAFAVCFFTADLPRQHSVLLTEIFILVFISSSHFFTAFVLMLFPFLKLEWVFHFLQFIFPSKKKQRQKYLIKSHCVARQVICICSYRYSRYTCSCMSFITCSSWFLIWLQNPLAYGFYAGLGDIRQMFMRPHNGNGDGKGKFN